MAHFHLLCTVVLQQGRRKSFYYFILNHIKWKSEHWNWYVPIKRRQVQHIYIMQIKQIWSYTVMYEIIPTHETQSTQMQLMHANKKTTTTKKRWDCIRKCISAERLGTGSASVTAEITVYLNRLPFSGAVRMCKRQQISLQNELAGLRKQQVQILGCLVWHYSVLTRSRGI